MVTVYLCKAGECATDALVTKLAKPYFHQAVPEIIRLKRGKPCFAGDTGIHFSVSHSGELVAVAFSHRPVGIDLQQHKRRGADVPQRHQKLVSHYFHPLEQQLVEKDLWEGFFRVWTAKESFVKRTGRGIDHGFSQICILPKGDAWEDENGFFRQMVLPSGYTLTLSAESPADWEIIGACIE